MSFDCVANQARPKPNFRWFIGQTEIKGVKTDQELNKGTDGKADYVQTLKYFADPKHNGQELKCVVDHMAYSDAQLADKENEITKRLELLCECCEFTSVFYLI